MIDDTSMDNLGKFGQVLTSWYKIGQVWTSWDVLGPVWEQLGKIGTN